MKNLLMVVLLTIISTTFTIAQTLDLSYPAAVTEVSQVSGAYLMADGKYLVYGDFKKNNGITKPGIIRFNADGTVDNTFNIGSGPNAAVETVAVQPDGKILIGGRFTTFNGVSRKILARLNSDGTLDNTFNPNIVINNTGTEANVLIQPDGKILFTGQVFSVDGFSTGSTLFRFNSNGTVDATFSGPSYGYQIQAMARQADGKIILVGSFTKGIVRLTTTGAVDATFDVGTGFESLVSTVQVTSTNQIIVGGHFATYKGAAANNLVCLTTTGAIDATWQGNAKPNGGVNDSYLLPDGKLLIAGYFSSYNSTSSKSLARLNTNGTLDGTLVVGTGANGGLQTIHANATGDIIVTGSTPTFSSYNGTSRTGGVAVLQSNGTLKSMTEQPKFHQEAWVRTIIEQGSNKYLIGHFGTEVNGTPAANLARLNADGTLDATFNGNGKPNLYVDAITVDRNGKILIGGAFTSYNGTNAARFTRLSADGTLESTFNTTLGTGFNGNVNVIAEQPDGKILVGGSFSTFNGGSKKALIRLNEDGTPDAAFNTSNGFSTSTGSTQIFDIEIQADGKILVGGEFSAFGVNAVKNLIRLNADGTFDNTFNIGAGVYASGSSSVNAITILSNGKILAGGYIRNANTGTNNVNYLALLSSTGAVENGYISNNFFFVEALKKQSDGKVLVVDRNSGLRRLNSDGSIDNTFTTLTFDYFERGVAILGNSLIAAGRLALAENKVVMGLAKYDIPAAAPTAPTVLTTTTVGQTTVDLSWTHTGTTESGFFVERSTGNNTSYTTIATLAANTTTYSNTGLTANTQYYYRVRAFNATGISAYSNELNTTTLNPIPAAPTNLSLTVISAGEIRINWTDASTNESGFEIHRSTSNNTSYSLLTTTSANAVTYSDLTVSQGVTYYYKIRSINNGGPSAFTTEQSAVAINPPPIAPTNLVLTSTSSSTIVITWTDNAFNEVDYIIERGTNSFSNLTELVVLPANTTEYTDATVTFGQSYAYRVRARNANGTSTELLSAVTAGTFLMGNKTITTCQGKIYDSGFGGNYGNNENSTLKLLPSTAGSALQLVFSSFSTEAADQLRIYDGETITDPLIGTYSGTTLPGTIRATNSAGALTLVFTSNATTVSTGWAIDLTCGVFPKNPTNLELAVPNLSEVKLNWTDNATNEVAYVIERSLTGSTADFTSLVTVAANSTSYSDNAAAPNTTYYYRVKAKGAQNDSEYTPVQAVAFGEGGMWRLRKDFDGIARTDAVAFAVSGKGYVGTGWAGGAQTANFRSYDPVNDSWSTAVANFGGSVRSEAAAFVIGTKAYAGLGEWLDPDNDVYEYDPVANTWTAKADFGGTARTGAIGFAIGTNGYFGLGQDASGYTKDFWRYDAALNTWTRVADFPGDARNGAVVFVIGDYAYAGSGYNGSTRLSDFYKYDPAANTWTAVAAFPGLARRNAVAFTIDGKGYVGTGDSGSDRKDFFRYDPVANTWTQVVNFGGTARSYASAFALNGKAYVTNGFDGSNRKDLWEFSPATIQSAPVAPSGLIATTVSNSHIDLTWTDNGTDESGFIIERSKSNTTSFEVVATVAANATSYSDATLDPVTTYYYRIKAITASGNSSYTANANATTAPMAPTALTATLSGTLVVQLAWTDAATGASGYTIERSINDNTNYTVFASMSSSNKTYNDGTTDYGTKYYYRVKATNAGISSAYSNEVSITTAASTVSTPTNLSAEAISPAEIRLRWNDNSDNELYFILVRSTNPAGPFFQVSLPNANATEIINVGLMENTTYYYKIRAVGATGTSASSAVATATTFKSPPTNAPYGLTATYDATLDNITLQWQDASDNEDEFVIEKALVANQFSQLASTPSTTYTDENPGTNFRVFYRVRAKNNGGQTGYSNIATIIITGVEDDAGLSGLKTYPNPAVDRITVEFTSDDRGEVNLSITDLTGRELKSATFEKNRAALKEEVNLADVAGNSILMMRISVGKKVLTRKIVLK